MKHILLGAFSLMIILTACNNKTKKSATSNDYEDAIKTHRDHYLQDFIQDERAPLDSTDLPDVHFFDADETYVVECTFTEASDKKPFAMATYSGITKPYQVYGYLVCPIKGQEIKLELYQNQLMASVPAYADHLFLPFKDLTNGEESYGGGRYIDVKASSLKYGKMKIDFNKAYNPWCAYSDGYNCPIPPIANHLDIIITSGESKYTGSKKNRPQ